MTREEAMLQLVSLAEHEGKKLRICAEDAKALQMGIDAIKALEQEPCEDDISRDNDDYDYRTHSYRNGCRYSDRTERSSDE